MAGESEREPKAEAPLVNEEPAPAPGADAAPEAEANEGDAPSADAKAKAAAAAKAKALAAAKAKAEAAPPRDLPSQEDIARWAAGGDANVGILFEGLAIARFDAFVTKIRNQEIVPQHWQVISALHPPDDAEFERLPEVGRLRQLYKDHALARRRLDAMKTAWRELRGKRPSLWAVPDLLAAMRRVIAKKVAIDWNDALSAVRDLWLSSPMPAGKEQVEILWAALALVRDGTKK